MRLVALGEFEFAMPAKGVTRSSKRTDNTLEDMRALFGDNFRQARLKAKLTQVDVEGLTGIRQHYVSETENGLHNLTLDTMTNLARAVGVELPDLLRRPRKRR